MIAYNRHAVRIRILAVIAAAMLLGAPCAASNGGQAAPVSDVRVRAAFLVNLAKFVRWPEASGPFVIGVAGDDALVAAVGQIVSGRTHDGRALYARAILAAEDPDGCDVLYIGNLNDHEASALLARTRGPVLTVGATLRFLRDGGIVRIFIEGDRMRFQVNRRQATDAGLEISSQLLSLAVQ